MNLSLTFAGVVEINQDPLKLGRLKVRVPLVYGVGEDSASYIGTNDLPWAMPAGMPAGASAKSGGFSQIPEPGDTVWVRFLDGEPEKPIWEWGMQTASGAESLKLHTYAAGTPVGKPDRTVWTRYNHAIELNQGSVILTTSAGYRVILTDADDITPNGKISVTTPKGNFLEFDDLDDSAKMFVLQELYFNVGTGVLGLSDSFSWSTLSGNFDVTSGGSLNLTSAYDFNATTSGDMNFATLGDLTVEVARLMNLSFSKLSIGLGATEPVVLGNMLALWVESLYSWLALHTHVSSSPGSITSPPTQPTDAIQPAIAALLSKTVTVQD